MALTRLRINEVPVDTPLPWPVYGKTGMLLLPKGGIIPNQDAPDLVKGGLYRNRHSRHDPVSHPVEEKPIIPGLSFPVENVHLRFKEEGSSERITVAADFLGFIPGVTLIVSHPQRAGRLVNIAVGQRVAVHMLVRKHIHAFQSEVSCKCRHPTPYLHLTYPDTVESSMVRNAPRIEVAIMAVIGSGDEPIPASINNLSGSGMGLTAEQALGETGDSVALSFTLPLADRPCRIATRGVIRSVAAVTAQKTYRYGIELNNLVEGQQLAIAAFIYQHI